MSGKGERGRREVDTWTEMMEARGGKDGKVSGWWEGREGDEQ